MDNERDAAVRDFLAWLYEHGPALDDVPMAWVVEAYAAYRAGMVEAG